MKCLLTRFDEDTITYFTYVDKMIHNLLIRFIISDLDHLLTITTYI